MLFFGKGSGGLTPEKFLKKLIEFDAFYGFCEQQQRRSVT